jgi:hypothetical protein
MKKEAVHFNNKKRTPKKCKVLKRPPMKKDVSHFNDKKRTPKNARGSKDL